MVVEGFPAGLPVTVEQLGDELARRRLGFGRGPRMRFERDDVEILGGVRHGRTLGSPISIVIHNTEWPKWQEEMSPAPGVTEKPLHQPRPGHADLVGMQKYGFDDARNVLERGERARDSGPRRRGHPRQAAARRARDRGPEPRDPDGLGAGEHRAPADARRPPHRRRVAGALLRSRHRGRDDRRGGGGGEGRRLPRRCGGGARLRRAPGPRVARALGPQDRRTARAGPHEHPGHEGRRARRRVRGRGQARQRGARRDPLGRRRRRVRARVARARVAPKAA